MLPKLAERKRANAKSNANSKQASNQQTAEQGEARAGQGHTEYRK